MNPWSALQSELRELKYLGDTLSLLSWDQQVNLPSRAGADRGKQISLLAKIRHARLTADSLFDLVLQLCDDPTLSSAQKRVVQRTSEDLTRARKRPSDLVSKIAQKESDTHQRWLEAREARDFSIVQTSLAELASLKKDLASITHPSTPLYDALLDDFEKGSTREFLRPIFEQLKSGVLELRQRYLRPHSQRRLEIPASEQCQASFFRSIAADLGFDFSRGRLDPTVHPFASEMGTHDVRLTTRFQPENALFGLTGFIHETGHGLYEQGLPEVWIGTPLGEACSLAVHESQSLLYEKQLGFSFGFQKYLAEQISRHFSPAQKVSAEILFCEMNTLSINLLRLSSDELGYALHIILRFELEEELFSGNLQVKDLPEAWREKTLQYFGQAPEDDLQGVLQDVHWYSGAWGYFPNYLLGTIYSAALLSAFRRATPTSAKLENPADFADLLSWLRKNIHEHGRAFDAQELIFTACQSGQEQQDFKNFPTNLAQAYLKSLGEKCEIVAELSKHS